MLTYTRRHKVTVPIDGQAVRVVVKQLTDGEYQAFASTFNAIMLRQALPIDRREHETHLTDAQVLAKRQAELTADQAREARERKQAENAEAAAWTVGTITDYVTFEPGQGITIDGEEVLTGAQIAEVYASRDDVMASLVSQVYLQNTLGPEQKKRLQSRLDSAASSAESIPETDGPRPAPTVDAVAPSTTAATATAATTEPETTSSGTTARSS